MKTATERPFECVVFIDLPDPDNILMVLHIICSFPEQQIAVVLSPRILDLSVPRYGSEFDSVKKEVGFEKMALPIITDRPYEVSDGIQKWFCKDADLLNPYIKEDTRLYVELSSFRIAQALQERGIDRSRYTFFWDEASLDTIKRPDMRHALHVHDFTYNFNEKEMDLYYETTRAFSTGGSDLRNGLQDVCHQYIGRQQKELAVKGAGDMLYSIKDLLQANNAVSNATLIIGGPFTEALAYLEGTQSPKEIIAMAGSIRGDRSIFKTQFNLWKDMDSAVKFLGFVKHQNIILKLVPTECAKGTKDKPCPYELNMEQYADILGENSLLYRMILRYVRDTARGDLFAAFDWITAITATSPSILPWERVEYVIKKMVRRQRILSFVWSRNHKRLPSRWRGMIKSIWK